MIAGEREEGLKGYISHKKCTKLCLFQAIWENQFYYLFGFLFLVFIILVVSCSQISIVMVYFQLCAEVRYLGDWAMNTRRCKARITIAAPCAQCCSVFYHCIAGIALYHRVISRAVFKIFFTKHLLAASSLPTVL